MTRAWLSWSSGKDSALALSEVRRTGELDVVGLLTTTTAGRVAVHDIPLALVEAQARALGLPLHVVDLPWPCPNEVYEERTGVAFARAVADGVTAIVFGDLFLADIRAYRERTLDGSGLTPVFPLWGRRSEALADELLDRGIRAVITCVDTAQVPAGLAGHPFDRELLADLPESADPCGENGELHTFVTASPDFDAPVPVIVGATVLRDGFAYAALTPAPRIVSLLPSATEMAYALGLGEQVVGVTHECTWPPEVTDRQRVSWSSIPAGATSAEIERLVVAAARGGPPTTGLDDDLLRALAPDVLLTQDLCAVCAVPAGDVDAAMHRLGCSAQVVSLDPSPLDELRPAHAAVASAAGRPEAAAPVVAGLRARLAAVRAAVAGRPRPRVFALEWADPPFNAGHWLPEMIEIAGGSPVLAEAGARSVRVTWDEIAAATPDVLVFVPCGHDMTTAVREGAELVLPRAELAGVPVVVAAHGDAYFSRPGPRLVDGVELLAGLLHPDAWPAPAPHAAVVLRAATGASAR